MTVSNLYIGIMTGNSLDAADVVITQITENQISDIGGSSLPVPPLMAEKFRTLKKLLAQNGGNIAALAENPVLNVMSLIEDYTRFCADAVTLCLNQYQLSAAEIAAIGFHGQTCAHQPPSIAQNTDDTYTLQLGDGQLLADLTGIPVVFDFRSDDIMNGGEGAPLAPFHNQRIAANLRYKGIFPLAFCNGGNTGNIAVVYDSQVIGWDTGPFNHFVDFLARSEKNESCDFDGKYGRQGKINFELLRELFEHAVQTENGDNFLLKLPPKSSDPAWYQTIPDLVSPNISFVDRIRTAEFFSAYIFAHALQYSPIGTPDYFLLFGGGWNNPVIMADFQSLLRGTARVLPEHRHVFEQIANPQAQIEWSDRCGFNGKYMEARIFADLAYSKLKNTPFTFPETTGCRIPTVCGIIAHPGGNLKQPWSRAAKGWVTR